MSKEEDHSATNHLDDKVGKGTKVSSPEHGDHSHIIDNDGCSIGSLESVSDVDGVGVGGVKDGCEKYAGMDEKELEAMALEKIRAAEAAWAAECDALVEERKSLLKPGAPPRKTARHGPLFHNMSLAYAAHPNNLISKEDAGDTNGSDAKTDQTALGVEEEEESEQVYCFEGSNAVEPPIGGVFAVGNKPLGAGNSGPAYEFGLKSGKRNGVSIAASLRSPMALGISME